MSRTRVLSVGGAILGTAVLISFTIGLAVMVREPGGEPDLVTGTIASSRVAGPILEQPPAVLPPPTNQPNSCPPALPMRPAR